MLALSADIVRAVQDHVRACYPAEAIVLLFASAGSTNVTAMVTMENQADKLHALDPVEYPRTSREWFAPNEAKLMKQVREHEARGLYWVALLHSHIDCSAYFSPSDREYAAPNGNPPFPHLFQVVVEARADHLGDGRAFRWDGHQFAEVQHLPQFARRS